MHWKVILFFGTDYSVVQCSLFINPYIHGRHNQQVRDTKEYIHTVHRLCEILHINECACKHEPKIMNPGSLLTGVSTLTMWIESPLCWPV